METLITSHHSLSYVLFSHLNDCEILELLKDVKNYDPTLTFDEFNRLNFQFINTVDDSDSLTEIDPEINVLINVSTPSSEYYSQNDFDDLLTSYSTFPMILMYNICSIPNNLEQFLQYTGVVSNSFSADIMCYCETRLSNNIEHLYKLKGYKLYTVNRNHYGGGVCMYVKDRFPSSVLHDKCLSTDTIESLFVETSIAKKAVLIGTVYRRPNANICSFIDVLENLLSEISLSNKLCIMLGDFNVNLLNDTDRNV